MPSPIRPLTMGLTGLVNNDIWTDGLPICPLTGVGMSANQVYREDGTPRSAHEYEDRSIHFCLDRENHTYLYAVFDGHDGAKAAYFASQRLPAELSFEQITAHSTEEKVREVFVTAFQAVEEAFLESIDHCIAERTQLLDKIPEDMPQLEAAHKFPETLSRLQELEQQIRGGSTAVVALIHRGVLYVGNVGDSRALLCKKDKCGVLKVKQLSHDHTTSSHEELQRLAALGLPIDKIKGARLPGDHEITRCIGNYFLKGGYKEFDMLSSATAEPVIPVPHITVVPIDDTCSFLLLMSDGLYKSYQEATGSDQVNKEIAQMVVEQFVEQATITSVAQTVVDKVVRQHHDMFLTRQTRLSGREDITLVVRNFSFRLRGVGGRSHAASGLPGLVPPLTPALREGHAAQRESPPLAASLSPAAASSSDHCCSSTASILHTSSSESSSAEQLQRPSLNPLQLDEDGRIDSYVSFNGYYAAVEDAQRRGLIPEHQLHLYK